MCRGPRWRRSDELHLFATQSPSHPCYVHASITASPWDRIVHSNILTGGELGEFFYFMSLLKRPRHHYPLASKANLDDTAYVLMSLRLVD